MSLFAAGTDLG